MREWPIKKVSLEMSDSSSTSSSLSTSSAESDEDDFRQMTVMAAEPSKEFGAKDDSSMTQPDHNKLGADLSLMSFLKQGPIRRGVVNAVNPMMPISTSEIFNPMQSKLQYSINLINSDPIFSRMSQNLDHF